MQKCLCSWLAVQLAVQPDVAMICFAWAGKGFIAAIYAAVTSLVASEQANRDLSALGLHPTRLPRGTGGLEVPQPPLRQCWQPRRYRALPNARGLGERLAVHVQYDECNCCLTCVMKFR